LSVPTLDFDESEEFLIYPSLLGIKYYDIGKKMLIKVLGKYESERFLKIAIYQGKSMRNPTGTSSAKGEKRAADPTIYATAFKKTRFYIFSKKLPEETPDHQLMRDILNERPDKTELQIINQLRPQDQPHEVILQTTMGDIHLLLYYEDCPKTCENFTKLTKSGYYDGMIFHRVIKGFMVQSGCPKGDGTGGQSIWGETFEDEIVLPKLKHERAFILSMANGGPNTNGSQFFITVIPCPWLDGKV
jgi:peptidylprolyl isomerase domain and WD repeat-containing protein 1